MVRDLVIVGAGILGTTASYLASRRHPRWRVLLIDRDSVASGATHYSVGLATKWGQTAAKRELASRASALFSEMASVVPGVRFAEQAIVWIVADNSSTHFSSTWSGDRPTELTGTRRGQLLSGYPDLNIPLHTRLYLDRSAQWGDPAAVSAALVAHLMHHPDFEVWEGVRVTSVVTSGENTVIETEDGRRVEARRAAFFPGPWILQEPWRPFLAVDGVRLKKVVALHVRREPVDGSPALYFFDDEAFLLPRAREHRLLLSITSREWDCRPDRNCLNVSGGDIEMGAEILGKFFAERAPIEGGRVFCDAYTPSRIPFFHRLVGPSVTAIAGGCSGSGFRLAPAIAELTLRLVEEVSTAT